MLFCVHCNKSVDPPDLVECEGYPQHYWCPIAPEDRDTEDDERHPGTEIGNGKTIPPKAAERRAYIH